jgi:allophanate hydrolase subunit 1
MVKWISLGLTVLIAVVAAIWSFENRYHKIAVAKEMKTEIEEKIIEVRIGVSKETLETFKDVQQSFQAMQQDYDMNRLDALRDRKYLLEKQLKADPNNELLKDRIEMMQRQIEKLENKLYN